MAEVVSALRKESGWDAALEANFVKHTVFDVILALRQPSLRSRAVWRHFPTLCAGSLARAPRSDRGNNRPVDLCIQDSGAR